MPPIPFFAVVSGIVILLYACGLRILLSSTSGDPPCEMTYMFEYPQYVRVNMPDDVTRAFYRYGLYAYGEGQHTNAIRRMKFTGIPVLFIPGSGGSFKQVRSLASVSLRKALNSRLPFHMDYFAVDLNEEYSAIYGGVLEAQTKFVRHAVLQILNLYKGNKGSQPTSVVLVGHSMGGVIAKGLFNDLSFDEGLVQVVLTLATPHSRPVVVFDDYLASYYRNTSKTWHIRRTVGLSNITMASIGGGEKDLLVPSDLIASWEIDMHTVTTTIPTVWRSVDHLCIMWCKELVLVLVRALFDIVDTGTKQVSNDCGFRRSVFTYHLLKRNGGKRFSSSVHPQFATFQKGAEWIEPLPRQLTITGNLDPGKADRITKYKNIMIRLVDHPQHSLLAVEAINHEVGDWVFVCKANVIEKDSRVCETGENLSNATMLWPSLLHKRKRVVLDLLKLQQLRFSHVILGMPLTSEPIQLHIDVHSNRMLKPPGFGFWTLFGTSPIVLVEKTVEKALRYEVDFSEVESLWHVLYLLVKPVTCSKAEHHAVAMFVVPWSNERSFSFINEKKSDPLPIRLLHLKPVVSRGPPQHNEARSAAKAEVSLDPSCTYTISVQSAPGLLLSQFVRFHSSYILAYGVAILLLTLRKQLHVLSRTGRCGPFHSSLCGGAKPYFILAVSKILSKFLSLQGENSSLHTFLNAFQLPEPSINLITKSPIEQILVPLILYAIAFGLVYIMGLTCMFGIVFLAKIMNQVILSYFGRCLKNSVMRWMVNSSFSDFLMDLLFRVPPVLVGLLLMLGNQTCGSLGLAIGGIFFYFLLCKKYEDYLQAVLSYATRVVMNYALNAQDETIFDEPNVAEEEEGGIVNGGQETAHTFASEEQERASRQDDEDDENRTNMLSDINVNLTVFLLYVCAFLPSIPSLLVWAHNYKYDSKLEPDPTLPAFVLIMIASSSCFWLQSFPNHKLPYYVVIGESLHVMAVFTVLYAPTRISFIPSIIAVIMILISAHQWISSILVMFRDPSISDSDDNSNDLAEDVDVEVENDVDSSHSGSYDYEDDDDDDVMGHDHDEKSNLAEDSGRSTDDDINIDPKLEPNAEHIGDISTTRVEKQTERN